MSELTVIVPSRGRPEAAQSLTEAFRDTCTADTALVFAIDDNDERLPGYRGVVEMARRFGIVGEVTLPGRSMGEALYLATRIVTGPDAAGPPFAVAFMGDDHRPRTVGWDTEYLKALHELGTGIVYGNDLLQGENLPTQVAMTSDIIRALGYMAPPTLIHLYLDNFWKDLGTQAGCLRYLPDVIVEHVHPFAGKAEWDEGYQRVNTPRMNEDDRIAYRRFCATGGLADAVAKVKALR